MKPKFRYPPTDAIFEIRDGVWRRGGDQTMGTLGEIIGFAGSRWVRVKFGDRVRTMLKDHLRNVDHEARMAVLGR